MDIILLIVGIFGLLFLLVAGKTLACWLTRKLLGIPKYPPYYEAKIQQLPYYLDDRIPPPN